MSSARRVRLGVIGAGRMGELHTRVATQARGADLVGVHDPDDARAAHVARIYETERFGDLDSLVAAVDALIVAAPTSLHESIAVKALRAGRHLLIEKPIATTLEEAHRIRQAAASAGVTCMVGHTERYNMAFRELTRVIGDERPLAIDIRRLNPFAPRITDADVTLDLLIHDVDLLLDLSGQAPSSVFATGLRVLSDRLDHVDALLTFPGGTIGSLTSSRITEDKIRRIEVTTPTRYVVADLLSRTLTIHKRAVTEWAVEGPEVKFSLESVTQHVQVATAEPLAVEQQDFIDAIREKRPPAVSVEDGIRALEVVIAVRILAERNAPPRISTGAADRPGAAAAAR